MKVEWSAYLDTDDPHRTVKKLGRALKIDIQDPAFEGTHTEHLVKFTTVLVSLTWESAILECLQTAKNVSNQWSILWIDPKSDISSSTGNLTIKGVKSVHWQIRRET
jgi:hypothetical protein